MSTVTRNNLLAYNLTTGALDTAFAPAVNGTINDVAVTPDHTKLIVVGNFTKVGTATRNRVAVFNLPSRSLSTTVVPNANGLVRGVAATNSTIFLGGSFSTVNGTAGTKVAAVSAGNGALTPFKLPVDNGYVSSVVVDPTGTQVVIGGTFTSVGGSSHPGFGLYRALVANSSMLPLPANEVFRDAGANAGVYHLASDSTSFYGTGWNYLGGGGGGNNEGYFQASWTDGSLVNLNDCHGDAYDVAPVGDIVYLASHSHNCITSGSVPQSRPDADLLALLRVDQGHGRDQCEGHLRLPRQPRHAEPGPAAVVPDLDDGQVHRPEPGHVGGDRQLAVRRLRR